MLSPSLIFSGYVPGQISQDKKVSCTSITSLMYPGALLTYQYCMPEVSCSGSKVEYHIEEFSSL